MNLSRRRRRTLPTAATLALLVAFAAPAQEISAERGAELFARLGVMQRSVEQIMGMRATREIPRSLISREEINSLVTRRLKEETTPEQMRQEELFLRLFGFVDDDFDLSEQIVDVLTEQATALYDYKTKELYLATWTPSDMQEFALAHELAHAIADQHYDLEKFLEGGASADEDLARSAVVEGQASWVMTEYVFRDLGRSMIDEPLLAVQAAGASKFEVQNYPVYSSAPLYIQETMLFPYTAGLIFQQRLVERLGAGAFRTVFENPPSATAQVLDPEVYREGRAVARPKLPKARLKGLKRLSKGDIGRLDHEVLLKQHVDEATADRLGPKWRGGRYEIWEDEERSRAVLRYASEWESPAAAREFFDDYLRVCESKWDRLEIVRRDRDEAFGRGDRGAFIIARSGSTVTSVEGLTDDIIESLGSKRVARADAAEEMIEP